MTPDQGRRFMFDGHPVRGQLACIQQTLGDIFGLHKYPPRVAEQLGQSLVAASLLGDTLKLDGSLVIQIKGNGPLHTLMVERDSQGQLRGIAKYEDDAALVQGDDLSSLYGTATWRSVCCRKKASATKASCLWKAPVWPKLSTAISLSQNSYPLDCG